MTMIDFILGTYIRSNPLYKLYGQQDIINLIIKKVKLSNAVLKIEKAWIRFNIIRESAVELITKIPIYIDGTMNMEVTISHKILKYVRKCVTPKGRYVNVWYLLAERGQEVLYDMAELFIDDITSIRNYNTACREINNIFKKLKWPKNTFHSINE